MILGKCKLTRGIMISFYATVDITSKCQQCLFGISIIGRFSTMEAEKTTKEEMHFWQTYIENTIAKSAFFIKGRNCQFASSFLHSVCIRTQASSENPCSACKFAPVFCSWLFFDSNLNNNSTFVYPGFKKQKHSSRKSFNKLGKILCKNNKKYSTKQSAISLDHFIYLHFSRFERLSYKKSHT